MNKGEFICLTFSLTMSLTSTHTFSFLNVRNITHIARINKRKPCYIPFPFKWDEIMAFLPLFSPFLLSSRVFPLLIIFWGSSAKVKICELESEECLRLTSFQNGKASWRKWGGKFFSYYFFWIFSFLLCESDDKEEREKNIAWAWQGKNIYNENFKKWKYFLFLWIENFPTLDVSFSFFLVCHFRWSEWEKKNFPRFLAMAF